MAEVLLIPGAGGDEGGHQVALSRPAELADLLMV